MPSRLNVYTHVLVCTPCLQEILEGQIRLAKEQTRKAKSECLLWAVFCLILSLLVIILITYHIYNNRRLVKLDNDIAQWEQQTQHNSHY